MSAPRAPERPAPAAGRPPLVALVGPTGSGKTALAMALSRLLPLEVISCDSQAVYRGLDVGTAKPTAEERAAVPHHLVDVAEPEAEFSAARFASLADAAIEGIAARGRLPLVVGGTGLYLRALVEGIFDAPPKDPALRTALEARAEAEGPEALHRELAAVDPETAARLAVRDVLRVVRALEIHALTGEPLSAHHARDRARPRRYRALILGVAPPRHDLASRVYARAAAMFEHGLVEEAVELGRQPEVRARLEKLMGYREALALAEGRLSREEAVARTGLEQRRYAKRQLTWFRALPDLAWLPWPPSASDVGRRAEDFLRAAGGGDRRSEP